MSHRVTSIAFASHAAAIVALFVIGAPDWLKEPADKILSSVLTLLVWAGLPALAALRLPRRAGRIAAICSLTIMPGLAGVALVIHLAAGGPVLRPSGFILIADIIIVATYLFALISYLLHTRQVRALPHAT